MTHCSLTVTMWAAGFLTTASAAAFLWAVTISITAGVAAAGPLAITAGAAAAAWKARRELRGTHVPDLAAANERENGIAAR